jgi:hypothetical protein
MAQLGLRFPGIDDAVLAFSSQVDAIRQDLYYCDVNFAKGRIREIGRSVRASSYVYLAAALERVINEVLTATLIEVSSSTVELRKLRLSLFALIQAPHLDSLQDIRGLKMWLKRSEVFAGIDDQTLCVLDSSCLPLDGRTIRPEHLDVVWFVFGFSGSPIPDPVTRLALTELANARNSVAHGNETPARVGGQKSVTEMLRLIDRIESVVINMWTTTVNYIANKEYLRA